MPREITYREALNEAIREEMQRDERVFVMGLGVGKRGGSFGVTRGLQNIFGAGRVIDTPISEASFTGMGIGAAMQGKRPIVEIMYIDFSTLTMDMMFNQAAKYNFITGGREHVPIVLRTQGGAGKSLAPQHSQSLEALYYHIPGLKLVMPSTPYDAKGLLKPAVRDENPVVFIEHKLLYDTTGEVPEEEYIIPLGSAVIRREGSDCTIVSYSLMAVKSNEAAEILESEGISCDVLDMRSLVPMDRGSILTSVKKTGRLVIVNEAVKRGSVASDISAWTAENAFGELKAPIVRVSGRETPIPYNAGLESVSVPCVEDIMEAVRKVVGE